MKLFLRTFIKRSIVANSIRLAIVVGTLLNLVNQGEQLLSFTDISWIQVSLNYFVPYCVASFSATQNEIQQNKISSAK